MCYGTKGAWKERLRTEDPLPSCPWRDSHSSHSGFIQAQQFLRSSVGKSELEARASGECYVYFAWQLVVYCAGGGLLYLWKCCHQSTTQMVPMAGPQGSPAALGSTWEGAGTINMKLFCAIKGSEILILILNETEQNREILFLNPSLDIAAQS